MSPMAYQGSILDRLLRARRDRRAHRLVAADLPARLEQVTQRWSESNDEPLPCEDPFFIFSAGWRSGSTLLQRMVIAGSGFASDGGSGTGSGVSKGTMVWGEPHNRAEMIPNMARQWRPFTDRWPPLADQDATLIEGPLQDAWIPKLSPPVLALRRAHRAYFDTMFGAPARELGYQRWGIKEVFLDPAHVVYLRWLFPASRMLFLVRNPQDAFLSYKTRGPWYLEWPERSIATGWSYGRLWSRLVTGYHALSQEGLGLLVRYEDLETSSERIAAHLGHHVPRPSELPRRRGDAPVRGKPRVGALESLVISARTRTARRLLD